MSTKTTFAWGSGLIGLILALGLGFSLLWRHQSQQAAHQQATAELALNKELIQLRNENERLSRLATEPKPKPERPPESDVSSCWARLGKEIEFQGLLPANQQGDGPTEPTVAGGLDCHQLQRYPGRPELYAYFKIEQAFKDSGSNSVIVEVEYFDADEGGHFRLDYDSYDESSRSLGAYTQSKERVNLRGTERWRKARFLLDDGRFEGRENDHSDFRVTVVGGRFFLRSIKVTRMPPQEM